MVNNCNTLEMKMGNLSLKWRLKVGMREEVKGGIDGEIDWLHMVRAKS